MNKEYCYLPQSIDRKISEVASKQLYAAGWTPEFVSSLRGAYDAAHGYSVEGTENTNPMWSWDINTEDYDGDSEQANNFWNIVETLIKFRNDKKKEQQDEIRNFNENKSELWNTISEYYPDLNVFYTRAAQLSHYFIQAIDNYIEEHNLSNIVTRQDIINGLPLLDENRNVITGEDGNPVMGVNSDKLFSAVFNQFMADYSIRMDQTHDQETYNYYQKEYEKIFNPKVWAALLITSKAQLKYMEGLKVGFTDNSATEIDISTLNENDFADLFDPENSIREGWQIMTDCLSAYGNLSSEVRRAISNINVLTKDPDGSTRVLRDDLGYPVRMNSITAYQNLMDLLRNCRSKSKMMKRIRSNDKFLGLAEALEKDEVLQTQLYNNFRKVFQPYVQIQFGFYKIKFYVLNRTKAAHSIGNYLFSVKYNPIKGSIAESSRFNWKSSDLERLKEVLGVFVDKRNDQGRIISSIWRASKEEQKIALEKALNALGIKFTPDAIENLVSNRKRFSDVVSTLSKLSKYSGLQYQKEGEGNFNKWLTKKDSNKDKGEIQKKIETIITKLEESGNGIAYENKCRTINGKGQSVTYYGDVQPNFMGDLLGKIQEFSEAVTAEEKEKAKEEFQDWLCAKYLSSTHFCDKFDVNGKPIASGIKNFLLRTLWEEATAKEGEGSMFDEDSFTSQFQFMRIITGKYDNNSVPIPFENFTTKQHFQQLVGSYFALDTQDNKKMSKFVYVPVFVLGDSGVCKVLKVRRKSTFEDYKRGKDGKTKFDSQSIVDELYNIFESELRRMTLFKDFVEQTKSEGYIPNYNIEKNQNKFTMLTFLNKEFEGKDFTKLGPNEVKAAISKYLERGFANFLKVGEEAGALGNKKETDRFQDILNIEDPKKIEKPKFVNLEERLKELYYNVYLSNLLQYQIFTGDLGFYDSIKDFQKRYKEVHAPGNVLDVDATWDGEEVVKANAQGIKAQKTMYFKDVGVSVEDYNRDFAEVLLRVHSNDLDAVNKAIKDGILEPKKGTEEIARQKQLQKLLGDKYGVYLKFIKATKKEGATKDSKGSSQTDGQGFRHIDSFRKVMIMAGLWNIRKEALYNKIKAINDKVIAEHRNITPEELETISAYHAVIMPLKPYMFTMEKVKVTGKDGRSDNIFIPVQHKYAEAILIPCLLPVGSKLREVSEFMGSNGIDLICADTVVKVGMWGQTDIEEKSSTDISSFVNEAKKNISKLPSSVKTDSSPLRIMSIEKGLDFNISVGETYNVKLDDRNAQYHILGYEQDGDQRLSKIWFTSSEAPNEVFSLVGSTLAEFIDAAGSHEPIKANTNSTVNVKSNLSKAKIHELDYADYRIQSNVPEHINVQRALGTQVRKLIMGNIDMFSSKVYDYLGGKTFRLVKGGNKVELTGRNLVSLYTSLIVANMMESFEKFKKNIENEQKLSNLLTAAIINNDRYSLHQLLDIAVNDGKFATPLYEGSIEHDTTAMIFSIFRKEVNKQDMKGGSAVQVSDWGITTKDEVSGEDRPLKFVTDEKNENVLYAEIEIPFNFSYTDPNGNEVKLKFNDYCNTDGTFKTDEQGNKLIEKDFPGILDIIAYRIPSERDYSMLNCKVVRCTEMTAGGTIRVPAQGTAIAGFDFDIDKLYLIRKDFVRRRRAVERHYTGSEKNRIFAKVYELDAARQRVAEAKSKASKAAKASNEAEEEFNALGHNQNDYAHIEEAFNVLFPNLVSKYTPKYDELEEEDQEYLEKQCVVNGKDLADFMRVWSTDTNIGFEKDAWQNIDESKAYNGSEVFHMLFDNFDANNVSTKGWKLFHKMWNYYDNYADTDYEAVEDNIDYIPKNSIIAKLRAIRDASGEYEDVTIKNGKTKRKYNYSLAHYWDTMIEQNPYMEDEDAYDKNKLFEQAAKEVGLWKKDIEYEEYLLEYDFDKAVSQNNRVARNNLIFELMKHRLMDPDTLKDRLTPGGFDNARSAAAYLKDLLGINEEQDAADPSTLLFYNQLNQVAAKLIGIFANQNTNHQLSSIVRQLDLTEPIIFDGMKDAKVLKSNEPTGKDTGSLQNKLGKSLLFKELQLSDGTLVDVDLNLAEFLAASVDAVKDPVLNYLNFNTTTAASGALLARMGYSTKDIGVLFNQPIIKEVCTIIQNSGGITTFSRAKNEVLAAYKAGFEEYKDITTDVSTETLADQIVQYREAVKRDDYKEALNELKKDRDFRAAQLSALKIFEKAYSASRELNRFINTTKFTASNAVGSTMGFFYNQQYKVDDYIKQEDNALTMVIYESIKDGGEKQQKSLDTKVSKELLANREKYIASQIENPFAFEQCMYDLNKELLNILAKYYPYEKAAYKERRDVINSFLPDTNVLDPETIDNIHRETTQHLLSNSDSYFNPEKEYVDSNGENVSINIKDSEGESTAYNLTNREYFLYKFPIELFNLWKNDRLPFAISKYLGFSYSDYINPVNGETVRQLHVSINLSIEQSDKNTFTDAWAALAVNGTGESSRMVESEAIEKYKYKYRDTLTKHRDTIAQRMNLAEDNSKEYNSLKQQYDEYQNKLDKLATTNDISEVLSEEEKNQLQNSIDRAININAKNIALGKEIAKGLFFHNYYKTGFGVGPHSFIQYAPLEVKNLLEIGKGENKMSYLDYIGLDNLDKLSVTSIGNRIPQSIMEFGYMFALNHPDNYKLVHRMPSKDSSEENSTYNDYFRRESFTINLSSSSGVSTDSFSNDGSKTTNNEFTMSLDTKSGNYKVYPVIMKDDIAYVAMIDGNYGFMGNISEQPRITYVRSPILGKKNVSSTYASTFDLATTIKNRSSMILEAVENTLSKEDQETIKSTQEEESEESQEGGQSESGNETFNPEPLNDDTEVSFTEEDVDVLGEKLAKCNKVTEDFLIEYLLTTLDEQVGGELEREIWVPKAKENLTRDTEKLMKDMPVKSSIISEATRRQLLIDNLVFNLKENIKAGKTKVYTNLTKEEIC